MDHWGVSSTRVKLLRRWIGSQQKLKQKGRGWYFGEPEGVLQTRPRLCDSSAESWLCAQSLPTSLHLTRPRKYPHLLSTNTLNSPTHSDPRENLTQAEQWRRCAGYLVLSQEDSWLFSDSLYPGLFICPWSVSCSMVRRQDRNRTVGHKPWCGHRLAVWSWELTDSLFPSSSPPWPNYPTVSFSSPSQIPV